MNIQRLADKIHSKMVKCFRKTGKTMFYGPEWLDVFPKVPAEAVYMAISLLAADGRAFVLFAEGIPQEITLCVNKIPKSEGRLRTVYRLLKEFRSWF